MAQYALHRGQPIIFMKVGLHAQEELDEIIERKRREYENAGMIFWGYGGNTCHPSRHVQPFVIEQEQAGQTVTLVMHKMNSRHAAEPRIAQEYSNDGVDWVPVPRGIQVRGSRYAMVLDELEIAEFDLDLRAASVAVGAKRGSPAADYIRGHVDKACLVYTGQREGPVADQKAIGLIARVKEPYAVFLR
jgi:hypothetical protein